MKINYVGGHFPDEKQTLLLKSALSPNPEAIMHFMKWLRMCGLENINPESETFLSDFMDSIDLGSQRLLPLVIFNVGEKEHPYFRFLLGMRKNIWVRNKQIAFYAQNVQEVFDKNNIPSIIIKGLDLASRYYPKETLRPMNDGDVMVPYNYKEQALKLALDGAFGNTIPRYDLQMRDFLHAIHLDFNGYVDVDLHWNIFYEYNNHIDSTDFIWKNLQTININNVPTKRVSDTHAFFIALLHGRFFEITPPIRWVADTLLILRGSTFIDWDEILVLTKRFSFKPFIKKAIQYLKTEFNAEIPVHFLEALEQINIDPLELQYYHLMSQSIKNNILLKLWYSVRIKVVYHKLFSQKKEKSLYKYLINWYSKRLKLEFFKQKKLS